MKTWITYLTSLFLALATALLLGDTTWILPVLSSLNSLAVNTGLLLALVMTVFSLPGAIASLRKDRAGGKLVSTSVAWALVTSVLLPLFTALISSAFPVVFPVSTTAGSGTIAPQYVTNVFQSAYQTTFSGNLALILSVSDSFLLPVVILAFIIGLALKPSADVIKPAYITINSFSEVMFRIARALNYFGYIFAYFTAGYFFTLIYQEKTFFVDAAFSAMAVITPAALTLILLPVLYEIFTKGKGNPFKSLYRNIASQVMALTSGNYIFTLPFMQAGERYNDGVQKRIAASSSPLYYIIGHGGSASVATFCIISVIANVTGEPVGLPFCLVIALFCALASFAGSLACGFEIMFITVAALRMLNINLYSAEVTMLGLLPLLSGLGCLIDSQIAILGASVSARRMGVDMNPSYKDIL